MKLITTLEYSDAVAAQLEPQFKRELDDIMSFDMGYTPTEQWEGIPTVFIDVESLNPYAWNDVIIDKCLEAAKTGPTPYGLASRIQTFRLDTEWYRVEKTANGNVFVLVVQEDLEWVSIGHEGTRGRFLWEMYSILNYGASGVKPQDVLADGEPYIYETTGPADMQPWERRGDYVIRLANEGEYDGVRSAIRRYVTDDYLSESDTIVIEWIRSHRPEYASSLDEARAASVGAINKLPELKGLSLPVGRVVVIGNKITSL